jgi:Leucine-rich repeat (LRR) protein
MASITCIAGLLIVFLSSSQSFDLECEFAFDSWILNGTPYTCNVKNLSLKTPIEIVTNIIGRHLEGKANSDVIELNINDQVCMFLPNNIETFFPNLESLKVTKSGLVEIHQKDLRVFPKLRCCDFSDNFIKTLDSDSFEKNPEINYLFFDGNKINKISRNILKPLKKLKEANFEGNKCVNMVAQKPEEIDDLQNHINENCGSDQLMGGTNDNEDENEHIAQWTEEIKELEKKQNTISDREQELFAKVDVQSERANEFNLQKEKEKEKARKTRRIFYWSLGFLLGGIAAVAAFYWKKQIDTRRMNQQEPEDHIGILPSYSEMTNASE